LTAWICIRSDLRTMYKRFKFSLDVRRSYKGIVVGGTFLSVSSRTIANHLPLMKFTIAIKCSRAKYLVPFDLVTYELVASFTGTNRYFLVDLPNVWSYVYYSSNYLHIYDKSIYICIQVWCVFYHRMVSNTSVLNNNFKIYNRSIQRLTVRE